MTTRSWIRMLFARTSRTGRKAPARFRPRVEALEDRLTPASPVYGSDGWDDGSDGGWDDGSDGGWDDGSGGWDDGSGGWDDGSGGGWDDGSGGFSVINCDQAALTVNEGAAAINTGTFDATAGHGTVKLTASLGTVTENDTTGAWSWSYTPLDDTNGPTTITITATDGDGLTATTSFTLTVHDVAPTIVISGAGSVNEGDSYTLTLGAVTDPGDDTVTRYLVNWGDNTSSLETTSGPITHVYDSEPFPANITVDLVDEDGTHTDRANSLSVTVNNQAPVITSFFVPESGIQGSELHLSAEAIDPGPNRFAQLRWEITAPDGSALLLSHGGFVDFTPAHRGVYQVELAAYDDDEQATFRYASIDVADLFPTIAISGAATVNEGATYTLTLGAVTYPTPGAVTQYWVNWGDGTGDIYTTAGPKTHTYDDPATRAITVDLVDGPNKHTNRANALSVAVNNLAPTITSFTVPASGAEGSPVSLSATATDPAGAADPLTFTWTITRPDGSTFTLSGASPSFTPADDGTYGVALTVSDGDGGAAVAQANPLDPVSWWRGEGNAADALGLHHGQLLNGIGFAPGKFGQAFRFNGYTFVTEIDMVTVADAGGLDLSAVTLEAWVNPDTLAFPSGFAGVIVKGQPEQPRTLFRDDPDEYQARRNYGLYVRADGGLRLSYFSDQGFVDLDSAPGLVPVGQFRHIAGVIDPAANVMEIYVNGQSVASRATNGPLVANIALLTIGAGYWADSTSGTGEFGANGFLGLIDEPAVYNRALSAAQIQAAGAGITYVAVANVAPTIAISGAASVNEAAAYTLTLGAVTDPGTDTVTQYRVNWGDGNSDTYTTAGAKTHVYADGKVTRAITVDLVDEDGAHLNCANTLGVIVNNVPPTPALSDPGTVLATQMVSFTLSATDPSAADLAAGFGYVVDWGDGSPVNVEVDSPGSGIAIGHSFAAAGSYPVTLFAVDKDNGGARVTRTVTVGAVTAADLQTVLSQQTSISTQAATDAQAQALVAAVNALPAQVTPVTVTVNLGAGSYSGTTASPPIGVTLILVGSGGATTLVGSSPSLKVTSGSVIVRDLVLTNATAAPTLEVSGGSLTLRNVVVQESASSSQAALLITGGTVDLGTAASPGGNTFNVNGPGELIRNTGAGPVSALGNTFQVGGGTLTSPYRIEDKIVHALDAGGGGLVSYVAGHVYVTDSTGGIQRGVDAVAAEGTVNVEAGSYYNYDVGSKLLTVRFEYGPTLSQQRNPQNASLRNVVVTGTAGNDQMQFNPGGGFQVQLNNLPNARFAPTGKIVADGLAGDDQIQVAGGVGLPAWLFGGAGNDQLQGGGGDDVLVGGEGNDQLQAGQGRDLLIGGAGADQFQGNAGDDLLISGTTAFDANHAALAAVMAEWTSARSYAERVANLRGTFLKASGLDVTVFDDAAVDQLQGASGSDWFFANLSGGIAVDLINGLGGSEVIEELGVLTP